MIPSQPGSLDHAASQRPASLIWLPRLAGVGGFLYFLTHGLRVILGPESTVMEWLYDDAFYYMITAKHFSERHISSFDGVTLTSGYHPLWMWLCALIYGLRGRLDLNYVRLCMALTLAIAATVFFLILRDAYRNNRVGMLWALGLGTCSYSALNNGATVMEWPLVLLCCFVLHHVLVPGNDAAINAPIQPKEYAAAFLLGLAGSFSRTDFGLFPAAYLAAAILLGVRERHWNSARKPLAAIAGSFLGVLLVLSYNHAMTGEWLQGSAEVKRLAASLAFPFNPVPAIWQFLRVLFYFPGTLQTLDVRATLIKGGFLILIVILIALAIAAIAARRHLRPTLSRLLHAGRREQLSLTAALIGIVAYILVYALNPLATFGWYTGAVTGFILLLTARALGALRVPVAAAIVLPLMLANIAAAEWFGGSGKTQDVELVSGKALYADHPGAIMGAGDAGKASFYNNGTMFNLDGLMNNEVLPYLIRGDIHCYILHRRIEYLYDVGTITMPIVDAERAKLGKPPVPWDLYFARPAGGNPATPLPYFKSNFDAIRASGECADQAR